jgi:hypothetical protein
MSSKALGICIYIPCALIAGYWSLYLTLARLYGTTFTSWSVLLLVSALCLLIGSILRWGSSASSLWLVAFGSAIAAAYFFPAFALTAIRQPIVFSREPLQSLLKAAQVLIVGVSFFYSLKELIVKYAGK